MLNIVGKTFGRYHVVEQLGSGGMATVFKAYDSSLERYVAMKMIRSEIISDEEFLKRFQREARALAQLDHPYILKVLDYGEQDGAPYLVMPFEPGGTLKDRMGSPWPYQEAARLLAPIARALEYAHQQNIIHRDVKPANILFTPNGSPILSDFGIAKMLNREDSMQLTGEGMGIGTPDYTAPEQWLGTVDARTDIYALGVVFYEMVTGRRPYTADTPASVMLKHMQEPLPPPKLFVASLPEEVEQIIFKSLAKKPEDRYQDMGAFAVELERISTGPTLPARPEIPAQVDTTIRAASGSGPVSRPGPVSGPRPATGPRPPTGPASPPAVQASPTRRLALGWAAAVALVLIAACLAVVIILFAVKSPLLGLAPNKATSVSQPAATSQNNSTAGPAVNTAQTPTPFKSIEGLPLDIPVLPENFGDLIKTDNASMTSYTFSTGLTLQQASDYYRQALLDEGWTLVKTNSTASPPAIISTYSKNNNQRMITVQVTTSQDSANTKVILVVNKLPQ